MPKSLSLILLGSLLSIALPSSTALAQTSNSAPNTKAPNDRATNAKTPNVAGTWKVSIKEPGRAATYIFTQQANTLTGTIGLPVGDMPISGTISNDGKLSFAGKARGMKFSFTGTLTGQTMEGIADLPIGRKNWTATK
jgi:hypothetical protein